MNPNEILNNQDRYLDKLEKELGIEDIHRGSGFGLELPKQTFQLPDIPEIPQVDFSDWEALKREWPTVDYDLFPRWRPADIPVMLTAGFLGTLLSNALEGVFDSLHDRWTNRGFDAGGHAGENTDSVSGLFHRLKKGHDPFNPREIEWDKYFKAGDVKKPMLIKVFAWLRHMMQDTFSVEGLPLPGHSYFRDVIGDVLMPAGKKLSGMDTYKVYKTFFTLKARDLTGAAFVPLAMTAYVYGTERGNRRKFFNYRYISLTIGALAVCITTGLLLPIPNQSSISFNYPAVMAMIPYIIALYRLNSMISRQLKERGGILAENSLRLQHNRELLLKSYEDMEEADRRLAEVTRQLEIIHQNSFKVMEECRSDYLRILETQEEFLAALEDKYGIMKGEI